MRNRNLDLPVVTVAFAAVSKAASPALRQGALCIRGIPVGVMHSSLWSSRPRQPDRRVANGRTHLENPFRSGNLREQCKQTRHRRPNNRHAMLSGVTLHLPDQCVALRQQLVEILFNVVLNIATPQIFAAYHRLFPGFKASTSNSGISRT